MADRRALLRHIIEPVRYSSRSIDLHRGHLECHWNHADQHINKAHMDIDFASDVEREYNIPIKCMPEWIRDFAML